MGAFVLFWIATLVFGRLCPPSQQFLLIVSVLFAAQAFDECLRLCIRAASQTENEALPAFSVLVLLIQSDSDILLLHMRLDRFV